MKKILHKIKNKFLKDNETIKNLNHLKIVNGQLLSNQNKILSKSINQSEFKIFSQFGEDGIIQFILNEIQISNQTFVEFGVENYDEANTRFLLEAYNWNGLIIDSSKDNINFIRKQDYFWKFDLKVENKFITKENINKILLDNKIKGNIGLLSIDIDGNDYWIWKELDAVNPDIVVIEYNARFGSEKSLTINYNSKFNRTSSSKFIYGASLKALKKLADTKGYALIYVNKNGNNAFFIKREHLNDRLKEVSVAEAYKKNSFNELIDLDEKLDFEKNIKLSNVIEV